MSTHTINMTDTLYEYYRSVTAEEPSLLKRLREETQKLPAGGMQISPEQGRFMTLLTELLQVKRALEVGVFTGYSSLCVALAMPANGTGTVLTAVAVIDETQKEKPTPTSPNGTISEGSAVLVIGSAAA